LRDQPSPSAVRAFVALTDSPLLHTPSTRTRRSAARSLAGSLSKCHSGLSPVFCGAVVVADRSRGRCPNSCCTQVRPSRRPRTMTSEASKRPDIWRLGLARFFPDTAMPLVIPLGNRYAARVSIARDSRTGRHTVSARIPTALYID
jgi:hypothetical protein